MGVTRDRWPPLPTSLVGINGPAPVRLVHSTMGDCMGQFHGGPRIIEVHGSLDGAMRWLSLYHEWTEMALWDTGLHYILDEKTKDGICDAVAAARLAELRARLRLTV